jgi:hypothetical protein
MAARTFAEIRFGLSVMGNGPDGRRVVAQVDDVAGPHPDVQTDARLGCWLDPGQTQDKGRRPVLDHVVLGIEQLDLCRAGTGGSDGERSSDPLMHELIDVRPTELAAEVFSAQTDLGGRGRYVLGVSMFLVSPATMLVIASRTLREIGLGRSVVVVISLLISASQHLLVQTWPPDDVVVLPWIVVPFVSRTVMGAAGDRVTSGSLPSS